MEHFDRKTGEPRLYDNIKSRLLTDDDLPEGITVRDVCELLQDQYVEFFALGGSQQEGTEALNWDDPTRFRYSTIQFPARGYTAQWDGVRKWIADRPEREAAAAEAARVKAALDTLYANVQACAKIGVDLNINPDEVRVLAGFLEKNHGV